MTGDEIRQFQDYFNMADELDGDSTLKSGDIECRIYDNAISCADTFGLPWPPELAQAENFAFDHPEVRS